MNISKPTFLDNILFWFKTFLSKVLLLLLIPFGIILMLLSGINNIYWDMMPRYNDIDNIVYKILYLFVVIPCILLLFIAAVLLLSLIVIVSLLIGIVGSPIEIVGSISKRLYNFFFMTPEYNKSCNVLLGCIKGIVTDCNHMRDNGESVDAIDALKLSMIIDYLENKEGIRDSKKIIRFLNMLKSCLNESSMQSERMEIDNIIQQLEEIKPSSRCVGEFIFKPKHDTAVKSTLEYLSILDDTEELISSIKSITKLDADDDTLFSNIVNDYSNQSFTSTHLLRDLNIVYKGMRELDSGVSKEVLTCKPTTTVLMITNDSNEIVSDPSNSVRSSFSKK